MVSAIALASYEVSMCSLEIDAAMFWSLHGFIECMWQKRQHMAGGRFKHDFEVSSVSYENNCSEFS